MDIKTANLFHKLKDIDKKLRAKTLKEQTAGLDEFDVCFQSSANVVLLNSVHIAPLWGSIMSSLCHKMVNDRNAILKNSNNLPAKGRFHASCKAVRDSIVPWARQLPCKETQDILNIFAKIVVLNKAPCEHTCLDISRSVSAIFSYRPHLDRTYMEDYAVWLTWLNICCTSLLRQDVSKSSRRFELQGDLSDLVDQALPNTGSINTYKKIGLSLPSIDHKQEDDEFINIISLLFRAPDPPFTLHADLLLYFFISYFYTRPPHTAGYLDALAALNILLRELELNCPDKVYLAAPLLWKTLSSNILSTKRANIRDHVVVSLRFLLPFISASPLSSSLLESAFESIFNNFLELGALSLKTYNLEPLSLDNLQLSLTTPPTSPDYKHSQTPFSVGILSYGSKFSSDQAITWSAFDLLAEITFKRLVNATSSINLDTITSEFEELQSPKKKRQKVSNSLFGLFKSFSGLSVPSLVLRLQSLYFIISECPNSLFEEIENDGVLQNIQDLKSKSAQVQNWVMICMAMVAIKQENTKSDIKKGYEWDKIWSLGINRLINADTCRVASFLCNIILSYKKVPSDFINREIRTLTHDIEMQGPVIVCDTSLEFMSTCLEVADNEVSLARLGIRDRIARWLNLNWKPLIIKKPESYDSFEISSIINLFCNLSSVEFLPNYQPSRLPLPTCACSIAESYFIETAEARQYILGASFPNNDRQGAASPPPSPLSSSLPEKSPQLPMPEKHPSSITHDLPTIDSVAVTPKIERKPVQRTLTILLSKLLESIQAELEVDTQERQKISKERLYRYLKVFVVGLLYESLLEINNYVSVEAITSRLLSITPIIIPQIGKSCRSTDDLLDIFSLLDLILVTIPDSFSSWLNNALLDPDEASDITINSQQYPLKSNKEASSKTIQDKHQQLEHIWKLPWNHALLGYLYDLAALILENSKITHSQTKSTTSWGDDDGDNGQRPGSQQSGIPTLTLSTYEVCHGVNQHLMLNVIRIYVTAISKTPVALKRDEWINSFLAILFKINFEVFIQYSFYIVDALYFRLVPLSEANINELYNEIFEGVLQDFQFYTNEYCNQLAILLVHSTMYIWQPSKTSQLHAPGVQVLSFFVQQLSSRNGILSPKSRIFSINMLSETLSRDMFLRLDEEDEEPKSPTKSPQKKSNKQNNKNDNNDMDIDNEPSESQVAKQFRLIFHILHLINDADIRVRYRNTSLTSRIFDVSPYTDFQSVLVEIWPLFQYALETFRVEYPNCPTVFLLLGNIMILSGITRRAPYNYLVQFAIEDSKKSFVWKSSLEYIENILSLVTTKLNLGTKEALFDLFAGHIARQSLLREAQSVVVPSSICSAEHQHSSSSQSFNDVCAVLIANNNWSLYEGYKNYSTLTENYNTLNVTFPQIASILIIEGFAKLSDPEEPVTDALDTADTRIQEISQYVTILKPGDSVLEATADKVALEILLRFSEDDCSLGPQSAMAVAFNEYPEKFELFQKLVPEVPKYHLYKPTPPFAVTEHVISSLLYVNQWSKVLESQASIYSILQELIASIAKSPFFNERFRYLYSLAIFISLCQVPLNVPTLRMFIRSLVSIFENPKLAPFCSKLIKWALDQVSSNVDDPSLTMADAVWLPLGLRKCAIIAYNHASKDLDNAEQYETFANDLKKFLEFFKSNHMDGLSLEMKKCIRVVKLLWPRTEIISSSALNFDQVIEFSMLDKSLLEDAFPVLEKLVDEGEVNVEQCKKLAWAILDNIPSDMLNYKSTSSFVNLLAHTGCQITPPSLHDIANINNNETKQPVPAIEIPTEPITISQRLIMNHLFQIFTTTNDLVLANRIYRAIQILSTQPDCANYFNEEVYQNFLELDFKAPKFCQAIHSRQRRLEDLGSNQWTKCFTNDFDWVIEFSSFLIDILSDYSAFYKQIDPIIKSCQEFSREIVSILVYNVLLLSKNSKRVPSIPFGDETKACITEYFSTCLLDNSQSSIKNRRIVISIINELREYSIPEDARPLSGDYWLDINSLIIAKACVRCGLYSDAILYLEFYNEELAKPDSQSQSQSPQLQLQLQLQSNLSDSDSEETKKATDNDIVRSLLFQIYSNIDEPDGFYGINTPDTHEMLYQQYRHEERWSEVFQVTAAQAEALNIVNKARSERSSSSTQGMTPSSPGKQIGNVNHLVIDSLARTGFNRLAFSLLPSSYQGNNNADIGNDTNGFQGTELAYELAWKSQVWDLPSKHTNEYQAPSVLLYSALKDTQDAGNEKVALQHLSQIMLQQTRSIVDNLSLYRPYPADGVLEHLLSFREIQYWWSVQHSLEQQPQSASFNIEKDLELMKSLGFKEMESWLLSKRILIQTELNRNKSKSSTSLLFIQDTPANLDECLKLQVSYLIELSKCARKEGQLQSALNYMSLCQSIYKEERFDEFKNICDEEIASVLWARGEHSLAIDALNRLSSQKELPNLQKATVLSQLGEWMALDRYRQPKDISTNYFQNAIKLIQENDGDNSAINERASIFSKYASFADEQLTNIDKSDVNKQLREISNRQRNEISQMKQTLASKGGRKNDQFRRQYNQAKTSWEIDDVRITEMDNTYDEFVAIALKMYGKLLGYNPEAEGAVFRFVSLWFEHYESDEISQMLEPILAEIPTYAFIPLAHQICARLSFYNNTGSKFMTILSNLITRICKDHPFHILYQLYSLRRFDIMEQYQQGLDDEATSMSGGSDNNNNRSRANSRRSSAPPPTPTSQGAANRARAAESIFFKLKGNTPRAKIVDQIELACKHFMSTCKVAPPNKKSKYQTAPPHWDIFKLRNLDIPLPTVDIPIDKACEYPKEKLPCIKDFSTKFRLPGGVNLPKVMSCRSTNGNLYTLLLKGGDDVRQDAVMEQVFVLVNNLLSNDKKTNKRKLRIRTYKVVPLIGETGLIEFAANTKPMKEWIEKAHVNYYGQRDWLRRSRDRFNETSAKGIPLKKKVKVFRELSQNATLRFYFREQHKIPERWLEMRTSYTRSVATSSIVGWMLGLGDRHTSNILMDKTSGEVVHVDLGVAFDAGLILPCPETIPFRLTREIIDGFGMHGVEGVFRKCSEQTLRVLREKKSVIMTILDVLKYDPLQKWTLTEEQMKRLQPDQGNNEGTGTSTSRGLRRTVSQEETDTEGPVEAHRALVGVSEKLSNALSVSARVNELILEATDENRLCQLFGGWTPWL